MNAKPIKRNKNIVGFSKEHHGALLFCWKIRWGIHLNTPIERISRYARWFWENHLQPHQQEEDTLLFFDQTDALIKKVADDHIILTAKFADIISGINVNEKDFLDLADFVEEHTRYEERIVFPHLEKKFTTQEMERIGVAMQNSREHNAEEDYDDEFWKNK